MGRSSWLEMAVTSTADDGDNNEDDVIFNQWVYRVLENSPEVAV